MRSIAFSWSVISSMRWLNRCLDMVRAFGRDSAERDGRANLELRNMVSESPSNKQKMYLKVVQCRVLCAPLPGKMPSTQQWLFHTVPKFKDETISGSSLVTGHVPTHTFAEAIPDLNPYPNPRPNPGDLDVAHNRERTSLRYCHVLHAAGE